MTAGQLRAALRLYAILDLPLLRRTGQSLEQALSRVFSYGVTALQWREKTLSFEEQLPLARLVQKRCRDAGVLFVVNDSLDLALELGAKALHLGQDDGPLAAARARLGTGSLIGRSAHCVAEARRAWEEGADYLGCGALYPTTTKKATALSIDELRAIVKAVPLPIVAIGGIRAEQASALTGLGLAGVAVCGGLFDPSVGASEAALLKGIGSED